MIRSWLALAVLCAGTARGAGPSYSAAGIVNASSFAGGPFAPNSVIAVFGSAMARSAHTLATSDLVDCPYATANTKCLPTEMNFVRVYVQDQPVPLLYVGPTQVNFLISTTASPGAARIRVVTEGIAGPEITVTLVAAAPALFASPVSPGYVIAQDKAGNLLTPDSPAHAGDTVVIYVTGLGRTSPNPGTGEMPIGAAQMLAIASLNVTLNGIPVPPDLIKYAGVTPYSAGLYQINLYIPERTGDDPELGVTAGAQSAQSGLKLPVR